MIAMMVTKTHILNPGYKCEACSKSIEPYTEVFIHWEIAEAPMTRLGHDLYMYYFHRACFFQRVDAVRNFEVPVAMFRYDDVRYLKSKMNTYPLHLIQETIDKFEFWPL